MSDERADQRREMEVRAREARDYVASYRRDKGPWWDDLERRLLVAPLPARRGLHLLDAGAGVGRITVMLADRGGVVDAVDLSFESLDMLSATAAVWPGQVRAVVCDLAVGLPVRDQVYDGVVSGQTIHHIPRREGRLRAWSELRRAARPGATLSATVYQQKRRQQVDGVFPGGPSFHRYSTADLRQELEDAGWRVVRTRAAYRFEWRAPPARLAMLLDDLLSRLGVLNGMGTYLHVVAVNA